MPQSAAEVRRAASLAESFALARPDVPACLVPDDSLARVASLAGRLPPIHLAGFEVTLGGGRRGRVDFQQCIQNADGELEVLRAHIRRAGWLDDAAWRGIDSLCHGLAGADPDLAGLIASVWLEFDEGSFDADPPVPALFLTLSTACSGSPSRTLSLLSRAAQLWPGVIEYQPLEDTLGRCASEVPKGRGITHLGLLLSRATHLVRAVIAPLEPGQIRPYLRRIGWSGSERRVEFLDSLPWFVDQLAPALDVGGDLAKTVGFEFLPGLDADGQDLWPDILSWMESRSWCSAAEATALLAWQGHVAPSERLTWPTAWILRSLLGPPNKFLCFGRKLSHIKWNADDQGSLLSKAYWGFGPLWLEPDRPRVPGRTVDRPAPAPLTPDLSRTGDGIQAGVRFLLDRRHSDGFWRDFIVAGTASDEWVTAYVGAALASLADDAAMRAAMRAWRSLLLRQRPDGGWGYDAAWPADADSTAWALRLAAALGQEDTEDVRQAHSVLTQNAQPNGGISTFRDDAELHHMAARYSISVNSWCGPHSDVTAAAAVLEQVAAGATRYLRNAQNDAGHWRGFWFEDPAYATALACEALAASTSAADRARVERAALWVLARPAGSSRAPGCFGRSLELRILTAAAETEERNQRAREIQSWLLKQQASDGSWPSSARFHIPLGHGPSYDLAADVERLFTTATVLTALQLVRHN